MFGLFAKDVENPNIYADNGFILTLPGQLWVLLVL